MTKVSPDQAVPREIHVGVSWLRTVCASNLRTLPKEPIIIHEHSQPISVLVRYDVYMEMQRLYMEIANAE